MTLDVIGLAGMSYNETSFVDDLMYIGFGWDFGALDETKEDGSELNEAMRQLIRPAGGQSPLDLIHSVLPSTRIIVRRNFLENALIGACSRNIAQRARPGNQAGPRRP